MPAATTATATTAPMPAVAPGLRPGRPPRWVGEVAGLSGVVVVVGAATVGSGDDGSVARFAIGFWGATGVVVLVVVGRWWWWRWYCLGQRANRGLLLELFQSRVSLTASCASSSASPHSSAEPGARWNQQGSTESQSKRTASLAAKGAALSSLNSARHGHVSYRSSSVGAPRPAACTLQESGGIKAAAALADGGRESGAERAVRAALRESSATLGRPQERQGNELGAGGAFLPAACGALGEKYTEGKKPLTLGYPSTLTAQTDEGWVGETRLVRDVDGVVSEQREVGRRVSEMDGSAGPGGSSRGRDGSGRNCRQHQGGQETGGKQIAVGRPWW